jgi:sporulation protein YlmC with PRC-barrel domain
MEEITEYLNLPVYTSGGTFVGNVENLVLDVPNQRVHGLLLGQTNPALVDGGQDVAVPYRWVRSFDDVLLLSQFPEQIGRGSNENGAGEVEEETEGEVEIETVE